MQQFLLNAGVEGGSLMGQLPFLIAMIALFYFILIRPQKKRDKAVQEMRSAIDVGDEIITIGGIIGLVVSIKEDWMVIETGSDRSKIRIARWAVQSNTTAKETAAAPVDEAAKEEKKEKKRKGKDKE